MSRAKNVLHKSAVALINNYKLGKPIYSFGKFGPISIRSLQCSQLQFLLQNFLSLAIYFLDLQSLICGNLASSNFVITFFENSNFKFCSSFQSQEKVRVFQRVVHKQRHNFMVRVKDFVTIALRR